MRQLWSKFARCRPRILTVIVFCLATAIIALSNLCFDETRLGDDPWLTGWEPEIRYRSYGWPLISHRLVLYATGGKSAASHSALGWYYSAPRLAANLLLWFILLTTSAGACERLFRRYRPRPRWSLRTLLIFVAVVAGLCAWYAKARNRAAIQDEIIASGEATVFVERWGPKWLDLLNMDPLRRRIVDADFHFNFEDPNDEQVLRQLAHLPDLRLLSLTARELTPASAEALGAMRQLRTFDIQLSHLTPDLPAVLGRLRELRSLSIHLQSVSINGVRLEGFTAGDDAARLVDECLAAIGQMAHLKKLRVSRLPLRAESITHLAQLKNLKALEFNFWDGDWNGPERPEPKPEDCLRAIARLTQLEWLSVYAESSQKLSVPNESLACLAGLTELNTLSLRLATDDEHMLSYFPPLPRLEALDLSGSTIDDDDLRQLSVLPRLKSLSFGDTLRWGLPFTRAGVAELAGVKSLEELRIERISSKHLLGLLALKRLKRLHLLDTQDRALNENTEGELTLDDGTTIYVHDLKEYQNALAALRESNPGIIIDYSAQLPVFDFFDADSAEPAVDAPEHPSSWMPGGDLQWMTPQELADFEKEGGRASFYGATWPQRDRLMTVEF